MYRIPGLDCWAVNLVIPPSKCRYQLKHVYMYISHHMLISCPPLVKTSIRLCRWDLMYFIDRVRWEAMSSRTHVEIRDFQCLTELKFDTRCNVLEFTICRAASPDHYL